MCIAARGYRRRARRPSSPQPLRWPPCWSASSTCPKGATWSGCARSPRACGPSLVDVHADADHHRSVFTLAGPGPRDAVRRRPRARGRGRRAVLDRRPRRRAPALRRARRRAVRRARRHEGRTGAGRRRGPRLRRVVGERVRGAGVPVRRRRPRAAATSRTRARRAFAAGRPTSDPSAPHPRLGATAVGARRPLVACNCVLVSRDISVARRIARDDARAIGRPARRARARLLSCPRRSARRCR